MESIITEARTELNRLRDPKYRDFQVRLIPTVRPESILGVRTPELRRLAGQLLLREDSEIFLSALPHTFFEENQLHAFMISGMKDCAACFAALEQFLPYVDNWATCDQMSPRVFRKHRQDLLPYIRKWIVSGETYTVRFGIGMLMEHFLDSDFDAAYPEMVASVRSDEYYVNMMIAWYFATALAKQYDTVLPYLENRRLDPWTHNKAIQKSIESYRITPEQKDFLKSLKVAEKRGDGGKTCPTN